LDRRRFDAGKNGGGIRCSFGSFPVVLDARMPEIPAVALSPETGSSCRTMQFKTLQQYHKYSVSVNSQYVDYCAGA
jgi:hypothetical protein